MNTNQVIATAGLSDDVHLYVEDRLLKLQWDGGQVFDWTMIGGSLALNDVWTFKLGRVRQVLGQVQRLQEASGSLLQFQDE